MLPLHVVAVVLLAAVLHAGWNVAVRAGRDRRRESALMLAGGAVLAVVLLPFLPALPTAAWPYVLISSLLNGVFFILVAEAYAHGGIALAYPLMRGVAPMMTLVTSWLLLGEVLPPLGWIGIAAICGGVVALAQRRGDAAEARAARFALANAVVISAYTLNDAVGVRVSHTPLTYTLWMFPLSAIPTLLWLGRFTSLRGPEPCGSCTRHLWCGGEHRCLYPRAVGDDARAGRAGGRPARDQYSAGRCARAPVPGRTSRSARLEWRSRDCRRRGAAPTGAWLA